ncbi:hypothetical protein [Pseudomarimonas salicorniae]|uniref:Uncharacterized protein n=1 Tax=Pseudomarimonas salicorniae TaxID=2933270 RepID=A0ABT0GJ61_9GAMM|nr:hypothetical protein [Lysobacter sp. CAU 1642]MCK7594586.1 hypothetical protein [Lysobacter sp. CAU 1642]
MALLLSASLAWALVAQVSAQSADRVVATRGDAVVFESDLREAFLEIPEDLRQNVVGNPDKVGKILDELLLAQQIVRDSEQGRRWLESLEFRPDVGAFKRKATEIMDQRAAVESEEDLQELAREYFLADPSQYRLPDVYAFALAIQGTADSAAENSEQVQDDAESAASGEGAESAAAEQEAELPANLFGAGDDGAENLPEGVSVVRFDFDGLSKQPPIVVLAARSIREIGGSSKVFQLPDGRPAQIKLESLERGRQRQFEEVRDSIVERLRVDLKQATVRRYTVPLGNLPIDINGEALNSVAASFLKPSGES